MNLSVTKKIMKLLGVKDYQAMYKAIDLVKANLDDYTIKEEAHKRGLFPREICKSCGKDLESLYSTNGVFDCDICTNKKCKEWLK